MRLELDTAPATDAVTDSDLLDFLKLSSGDDDAMVAAVKQAATGHLDGRDGYLNRALITQTWKLHVDGFPDDASGIEIPLPPIQSVDSVTYVDGDGATQTLSTDVYKTVGGYNNPARLVLKWDQQWPTTREQEEAVTITFTAGYGDAASDVPMPIRLAIKVMAGDFYEHRQSYVSGRNLVETKVIQRLLAPFYVARFY